MGQRGGDALRLGAAVRVDHRAQVERVAAEAGNDDRRALPRELGEDDAGEHAGGVHGHRPGERDGARGAARGHRDPEGRHAALGAGEELADGVLVGTGGRG